MKKVMFVASTGGHLSELMSFDAVMKKYDYSLITERTKTNLTLKKKHKKTGFLLYGTKDHKLSYPFKLLINCFISLYYYFKYQPDYIVTTGAHTAGPICCIARIFGTKVIYIESLANIKSKTITGRLFYNLHIANLFIVQWPSMLKLYPKAVYKGRCF